MEDTTKNFIAGFAAGRLTAPKPVDSASATPSSPKSGTDGLFPAWIITTCVLSLLWQWVFTRAYSPAPYSMSHFTPFLISIPALILDVLLSERIGPDNLFVGLLLIFIVVPLGLGFLAIILFAP